MNEIWAIILAAGESRRMKVPKMLLPINGLTMIETVIRNVAASHVDQTLIVLGSFREEIQKVVGTYPVMSCYNENYRDGMLSSVRCGINNLPEDLDAAVIFPGDQPFIETRIINQVINAYRNSGKGIIIPLYKKKRGHPLLVGRKYFSRINELEPAGGLKALASLYPHDVLEVVTNSPGILKDIDTKEDYLNEINKIH